MNTKMFKNRSPFLIIQNKLLDIKILRSYNLLFRTHIVNFFINYYVSCFHIKFIIKFSKKLFKINVQIYLNNEKLKMTCVINLIFIT